MQSYGEQIRLTEASSKKLVLELEKCDKVKKELLDTSAENKLLIQDNSLCKQELDLTVKDKDEFRKQTSMFKEEYTKKVEELDKEKASKPSRFTWFGYGAITTVILGIVTLFLVQR